MKFTIAIACALLRVASAATPQRRRTNMIEIPRVLEEKVTHEVEEYDPNLGIERELQGSMSMSMPDDGAGDGGDGGVDEGDSSDGGDGVEAGGEDVGDGEDGGDGERSASSASAFAISGIVSAACVVAAYGLI